MVDCSPSRILLVTPDKAPPLEPYADISGIGVIVGFLATAYIAALLVAFNYLFAHNPLKDPFAAESNEKELIASSQDDCQGGWNPNPIDIWFLQRFRKLCRIGSRWSRTAKFFDECILSMCDIQLMTGFAILISGFVMVSQQDAPLSAFHWLVVSSLAWFSCVTHLSGLTVLRSNLSRYPWMKLSRVVLMLILLLMVVIALAPTGFFNWASGSSPWLWSASIPNSPAVCYFDIQHVQALWGSRCLITYYPDLSSPYYGLVGCYPEDNPDRDDEPYNLMDTIAMQSMILMGLLLIWGFTTRCFKLFHTLSRGLKTKVRSPLSCWAKKFFQFVTPKSVRRTATEQAMTGNRILCFSEAWIDLGVTPLFSIFLCLRIITDIFSSMLVEVLWVIFTVIWGTLKLHSTLRSQAVPTSISTEERIWTFGQVMAVILAASPVFTMIWRFAMISALPGNTMQGPKSLKVDIESGTGVFEALSQDPNRRGSGPESSNAVANTTSNDSLPSYLEKDYYKSATWISPFLVSSFAALFGIILSMIFSAAPRGGYAPASLTQFWITYDSMIIYLLFGYPFSCAVIITAGIQLDYWFASRSGWKWCILCVGGIFCHAIYILVCYRCFSVTEKPFSNIFRRIDTQYSLADTFLVATMMYAVYVICYVLRGVWRIWCRSQARYWQHFS